MPDQRHESHHKICNLRYGTHGYLWVLPLVFWIDGMFYTECTSKSQTYAVVIVKLFHSCKHSYFVSVCRFQTTFCGVEYNLRFHSRFGTRFHFDEKFNAYEL